MIKKEDKVYRILQLYDKFRKGLIVNKHETALELGVNDRTIQRDIENIRTYLSDFFVGQEIVYDRDYNGYRLKGDRTESISAEELLSITKILLESRALNAEEMQKVIQSLLQQSNKEEAKLIQLLVGNELIHYEPLQHNKPLLELLWQIAVSIKNKQLIEIVYDRMDLQEKNHIIKPVSIMFSEYYFYIVGFMHEHYYKTPAVFRVDRIKAFQPLNQKYKIPEQDRLEEGVLRKRVQFMYTGELIHLRFKFMGVSLEAVLDRFPNATVVKELENGWLIEAEVYGSGCMMWLLSQGEKVEVVHPIALREEMKQTIHNMMRFYQQEQSLLK